MGNNVLVFKSLKGSAPGRSRTRFRNTWRASNPARIPSFEGLRCCVGAFHPGIAGYSLSYADAGRLQTHYPARQGLKFAHRRMSAALFDNLPADYREMIVKPYICAIKREFGDGAGDAVGTARALLENGFRYDDAAQSFTSTGTPSPSGEKAGKMPEPGPAQQRRGSAAAHDDPDGIRLRGQFVTQA